MNDSKRKLNISIVQPDNQHNIMKQLIKEKSGTTMMSVFNSGSYSLTSIEVTSDSASRSFIGPKKFSRANMYFDTLTGRGPKRKDLNIQSPSQYQQKMQA